MPDSAHPLPAWCRRNREVMPAEAAPCAFDLPERLTRHNPRWGGEEPAGCWVDGAPLGNGDFGAMIYGPPENLTCILGKTDLWIRSTERSFFPPGSYADLLRIYRAGDREAFTRLQPSDPHWADSFRPSTLTNAGFFRLHLAEAAGARGFERELSLHDAVWHARFAAEGLDNMWPETPDFELLSFVSPPHEVMVLRVRRARLPLRSFTWRLNRERHPQLPPPSVGEEMSLAWLEQELLRGDRYALAVYQAGPPVVLTPTTRGVVGECDAEEEREAVFYLAAASRREVENPVSLACERAVRAAEIGVDALYAAHAEYWAEQWGRCWVQCAEEPVERAWYMSNYLAGSTLRPGKVSPGLQGMWVKENRPPWNADFHGNVNIQAIYQGILGANRMELFEPYVRLYHEMLPQCRRDTRAYFGVEGVRFPHAGDIDGFEVCDPPWFTLAVSLAPSSWIARLFWWAYQHTLDRDFLAETAYPILREVARCYLGLLWLAGKGPDGRWRVEPSIWGEACATTFDAWSTDSSYDTAAMMAAFQQACDGAEILGADPEEAAAWREALAALPPLPVDEEGIWLAWPHHPRNFRTGAGSFFYQVFPCEVASAFHGPEELREGARTTWAWAREQTSSAWCGGTPTAAAARMGDAEWALRSAAEITRNGLNANPVQGLIQADHGTGMALALNSMLLLGLDGALILFPGLPARVDAAFHSLRAPGAVLVSAAQSGGKVTHAAFQSLRGGPLRVLNPFDPAAYAVEELTLHVRKDGEMVSHFTAGYRDLIEWEVEAGAIYRLDVVK